MKMFTVLQNLRILARYLIKKTFFLRSQRLEVDNFQEKMRFHHTKIFHKILKNKFLLVPFVKEVKRIVESHL